MENRREQKTSSLRAERAREEKLEDGIKERYLNHVPFAMLSEGDDDSESEADLLDPFVDIPSGEGDVEAKAASRAAESLDSLAVESYFAADAEADKVEKAARWVTWGR